VISGYSNGLFVNGSWIINRIKYLSISKYPLRTDQPNPYHMFDKLGVTRTESGRRHRLRCTSLHSGLKIILFQLFQKARTFKHFQKVQAFWFGIYKVW